MITRARRCGCITRYAPITPEIAPDAPRLGMNGLSPKLNVDTTWAIDASTPVAMQNAVGMRVQPTGPNVARRVADEPEIVLDVVTEDPQEQHAAEQVHQAAMHELRDQQREIVGAARFLQGDARPSVAHLAANVAGDVL